MKQYDILIIIDHYLPGRLAGGPVTTISNMVSHLSEHLNILIVTRNNDLDGKLYDHIDSWRLICREGVDVLYLSDRDFNPQVIDRIVHKSSVKYIYLNSFFSRITVTYLMYRKLHQILGCSRPYIILAPRGEFSKGALQLRRRKKSTYVKLFKLMGLKGLISIFQASSSLEKQDIDRVLGEVCCHIAPDVPAPVQLLPPRTLEMAQLAFISRISPKKNLLGALDILSHVSRPCQFDIYGPQEDMDYWKECEKKIAALPDHVTVTYKGNLVHDKVVEVLGTYSAFLFPTHGENFGHVIFEALSAGCPVLVSDQTPWQDLEEHGVGWVKPLADQAGFVRVIEQVLQDPLSVRRERAQRCMAYAKTVSEDQEVIAANLELFSKY